MQSLSLNRRARTRRGVTVIVAGLMAAGACVGALTAAQASDAAGTIRTMAGYTYNYSQGGYGPDGAAATLSQFYNPRGLGFGPNGDVYVTDALNQVVRRIDSSGAVHLVAGTAPTQNPDGSTTPKPAGFAGDGGPATSASLWEPHGVAVDSAGRVFIADSGNCAIRMVENGIISTIAGHGGPAGKNTNGKCAPTPHDPDGLAKDIALDTPKSIFMTKENGIDVLYVTDSGNNEIRKIDVGNPNGIAAARTVRVAGNNQSKRFGGDGGPAIDANLRHAEGIWVANDHMIYITDGGNNLVRTIDTNGIIRTIAGDVNAATASAGPPSNVAQLPGDSSGDGGLAKDAHIDGPRGIAGDNAGNLYIAEEHGARVRRINLVSGVIDTIAGDGVSSPVGKQAIKGETGPALGTEFNFIHDMEINPADGSLWIADSKDNRVRAIFDPAHAPGAVVPSGGNTPTTTLTTQPPGGGGNPVPGQSGYWMLGSDGKIFAFGDARSASFGDPSGAMPPGAKAVHIEPSPSNKGYWVVADSGDVYAYGDATFAGGVPGSQLLANEKVTSLSPTLSGKGYWIFTSRGRVFPRGDAQSFGDLANITLNGPVKSSIATPSGKGYYMVASDGGVFAFGDANFLGSMGAKKLNQPVESLVPTRDGQGYWLVASDGGIFAFGSAPFRGSMGATKLNKPVTGMVRYGNGYMMVAADGGIFDFSDKAFVGSLGNNPPANPIVFAATLDS
jgi:sugar lactone lactonase YvrE